MKLSGSGARMTMLISVLKKGWSEQDSLKKLISEQRFKTGMVFAKQGKNTRRQRNPQVKTPEYKMSPARSTSNKGISMAGAKVVGERLLKDIMTDHKGPCTPQ